MKRWILVTISLILLISVAPATAQTFDNSGGGSWKEYISFPIMTIPSEHAQYKIVILGNAWEIYNVTGSLEVNGTNQNFWSLVQTDGDDIRVFNDSNMQLYFWIQEFNYTTQTAVIWVNLTPNSKELNIAYGNPSATKSAYDNESLALEFVDEFDGTALDTSKWDTSRVGTSTLTVSNGVLVFDTGGTEIDAIIAKGVSGEGYIIEAQGQDLVAYSSKNFWIHYLSTTATTGHAAGMGLGADWYGIDDLDYPANTGTAAYQVSQILNDGDVYRITIKTLGGGQLDVKIEDITTGQSWTFTYSETATGTWEYGIAAAQNKLQVDYFRIYKLADPADFGSPIVKPFQKQFGTKTIYVNITYLDTTTTSRYNPIAYYRLEDKPQINVTSQLSVSGVNATSGVNISIELINLVALDSAVYNGTDITANLTYQGTITNSTTGYIYNVYNFTTYENGTLEIYGHVSNEAYNTTYKLDGEVVDVFNTTAILGETLEIQLPHTGNVSIASSENVGVTSVLINTKDLGSGAKTLTITIDDPENFTVGYKYGTINIDFGKLNISVRHSDSTSFTNAVISIFNNNYSILSTDVSKLYAGENVIDVYFHGVKLKSVSFYLNHTTNGANITIDVNSTMLTDYRGLNRTIASPYSFNIVNLSSEYPYSVIGIYNYSGTVIIDFGTNPPTSVSVVGADSVEYNPPVLKFSGSGNATVIDLYKLGVTIKDRLGNPVNFYINVNGSKVNAVNGVATKLAKPSWYEVSVPTEINGFELWIFNGTSSYVTLVEVNTSDKSLTAEYRVPTTIDTNEVRLTYISEWLPLPFLAPKQEENVTIVRLEGTLKDFYGSPIANKPIAIKVSSTNYTRIYNTTTDGSGNFKLEVDMAKGIEYTVTYSFAGNDIYVGTSTSKTFYVESLLPAPPAPTPTLLIAIVVAIIGAGAIFAVIYIAKKRTVVARTRVEGEFKYFRRLK